MRNRMIIGIAAMAVLLSPVAVYAASFLDIRLADVKTSATKRILSHKQRFRRTEALEHSVMAL